MTGTGRFSRFNGQAVFALVLLLVNTVYASQIPALGMPFSGSVEPGAAFLPIVLCAMLYVGALRILVSELRQGGAEDPRPKPASETVPLLGIVGPVLVIALTALFAYGLQRVGYFMSAGLYTFGVALLFNYEHSGRPGRAAGLALVTAAAITGFGWLFFVRLFGLSLPGWSL